MPEHIYGKKAIIINSTFVGDIEEGQRVLKPLRNLDKPVADLLELTTYTATQSLLDAQYAEYVGSPVEDWAARIRRADEVMLSHHRGSATQAPSSSTGETADGIPKGSISSKKPDGGVVQIENSE